MSIDDRPNKSWIERKARRRAPRTYHCQFDHVQEDGGGKETRKRAVTFIHGFSDQHSRLPRQTGSGFSPYYLFNQRACVSAVKRYKGEVQGGGARESAGGRCKGRNDVWEGRS